MTKTLTVVVVIQLKLHKLHEELPTQFIGLRAFIKLRLNPVAAYRYVHMYGIASGIGHKVVGRLLLATSYYVYLPIPTASHSLAPPSTDPF